MRNRVVIFLTLIGLSFIALSLLNIQIIQGRKFRELSDKNCIRLLNQSGARGRILDRNNKLIIGNRLSYDLLILPQQEEELYKALASVSRILDISAQKLKEAFDNGYVASTIPVAVAKNIDMKKAIALEELKLDFPSIVIQPHPLRDYPFGKLACHVTGYLNEIDHWRLTRLSDYGYKTKDIVGFGGIEEKYDYYLREEDGALSVEVDHQGRFMRVVGFKPPRNGKDIQLTLDLRLQKIVEDKLADKPGSVILMNPDNGEVLAMASSPDFYPSAFIRKSGDYISRLVTDQEAPLVNRAISGVYPAGSIFKPITATAALEPGKIDLSTVFTCTGGIYIGEQEFSCWSRHGEQNLFSAMAHSCNTFFYKTGLLAGAQRMHDYAVRLGLARITAVDLPYESAGFVPSPLWKRIHRFKGWFSGDTANLSIGQGDLLVTPIQMTRMAAVFANKGMLVTPYLVKAVGGRDICSNQRKISRIALKENTIAYIREGMRMAVSDPTGTASVLSGLATPVAGKTGTVQVPHGQPHAWFVGFFPYKNPRFVICVFLEHGGSGEASCILARQIIEMMTQEGLI